jgi:hypothetical protein
VTVVLDSSALITLARIGRLELLHRISDAVHVPNAVFEEVVHKGAGRPGSVEGWCRPGRRLRLLAGTDFALTELELLRRLELTGQAHCRILHSVGPGIFHPKIYLIDKGARRVVYVGSSNLTRGGLQENVEACMRLA